MYGQFAKINKKEERALFWFRTFLLSAAQDKLTFSGLATLRR